MYLNQFSARVKEGNERSAGYVEMVHGRKYTLKLRNDRNTRCDARVEVDGKHAGTFRIGCHQSINLERPANDTGCFTFYELGTPEAEKIGLVNDCNLGLIKVTFTPELFVQYVKPIVSVEPITPWVYNHSYPYVQWVNVNHSSNGLGPQCCGESPMPEMTTRSCQSAGGTGLSGYSDQKFHDAARLQYDYSQETVIHLRLVPATDDPRPLVSHSSPIPPRI